MRDAATTPGPCVFPRCVKGEQPSYCGHDCDVREKPYEHEYGTPADGLAAKDSKFGPAEGGGALARRRRATGSGHIAEAGEADTSPELIVGATDSSRQAQSPHAAYVQEIVAGWREGRPVLDSLADEQLAVADAVDSYRKALAQIESVRAFHISREVSEMRRIARQALA